MDDGDTVYETEFAPGIGELDEHTLLEPEYHWYVYDPVPPKTFAVRVTVCPLSIIGDLGVNWAAISAGYTVTKAAEDAFVLADVVPVSVTL